MGEHVHHEDVNNHGLSTCKCGLVKQYSLEHPFDAPQIINPGNPDYVDFVDPAVKPKFDTVDGKPSISEKGLQNLLKNNSDLSIDGKEAKLETGLSKTNTHKRHGYYEEHKAEIIQDIKTMPTLRDVCKKWGIGGNGSMLYGPKGLLARWGVENPTKHKDKDKVEMVKQHPVKMKLMMAPSFGLNWIPLGPDARVFELIRLIGSEAPRDRLLFETRQIMNYFTALKIEMARAEPFFIQICQVFKLMDENGVLAQK
jgi:hypothetical protein